MWKLTKEYWKDMWVLLWSKTTVDEIILAKASNIKDKANKLRDKAKEIKKVIKK
tara:strand:- start:266 stop:427 length:162 start_codon:yes stop_codon:yes gene_type:complete